MNRLRLLLFTILLLAGCHDSARLASLPPGSQILAFGDSITFGSGAAPGEDYPARLAAISGWQVHNAGIPGDTANAAQARIREAIAQTRPALVIVEIGGNDFLQRRPEAAVKDDLRAIVGAVRQSGSQVVLVAVPRLSLLGAATGRLPDSAIYAELAKEEKLPLVEGVLAAILSDPTLKADPIHPNAGGYRKLADGIAEQLRRTGLLKKP
ncbi:MAG: Acyl-CoA thioesterase I precursor [Candidatus Accumulibacter phosphatis]|uniref:Acyl-CoA thioesterase I n=1 Tax=Candidatus Accumulibacter phosphatis TaxID=327160 RepID=A0A080LXY7_9PROT|nr:GDSL-type esterase/lipase family protein [Accumulibacter sp.]KFB73658.1 MAG: Acyl-CoA thioesterase I precursor [Candidatus Accumulibacter phosphatis]